MNREEAARRLQLRRSRAEYQALQRRATLVAGDAQYAALIALQTEKSQGVMEAIRLGEPIRGLTEEIGRLRLEMEERAQWLVQEKKLPGDYLAYQYSCGDCKDTGQREDGGPCRCFTALLMEGKPEGVDGEPSFEDFDENLYPTEEQRKRALEIRDMLLSYIENYGHGSPNLLFSGEAGLGKSFFLGATAKEISKKGFSVRYLSAYDMLERFKKKHLNGEETIRPLCMVDFLVLDDLGTESMLKNVTVEYLLAVLNKRSVSGLPIAVATNLSPIQIKERYGERVVSRLIHRAKRIRFQGEDLRLRQRDGKTL